MPSTWSNRLSWASSLSLTLFSLRKYQRILLLFIKTTLKKNKNKKNKKWRNFKKKNNPTSPK